MVKTHDQLPKRKNLRLKNYDYSSQGFYFVTICTQERQYFFGKMIKGQMQLNKAGVMIHLTLNEQVQMVKDT